MPSFKLLDRSDHVIGEIVSESQSTAADAGRRWYRGFARAEEYTPTLTERSGAAPADDQAFDEAMYDAFRAMGHEPADARAMVAHRSGRAVEIREAFDRLPESSPLRKLADAFVQEGHTPEEARRMAIHRQSVSELVDLREPGSGISGTTRR